MPGTILPLHQYLNMAWCLVTQGQLDLFISHCVIHPLILLIHINQCKAKCFISRLAMACYICYVTLCYIVLCYAPILYRYKEYYHIPSEELPEGWRKMHNGKLYNFYSSPDSIRVIISRRTRWGGLVVRMSEM